MDDVSGKVGNLSLLSRQPSDHEPPIYNDGLADVIYIILRHLASRDLYAFARVSKKFHADVEEFCEYECKKIKHKIEDVFEHQLTLPNEQDILRMIREQHQGKFLHLYALSRQIVGVRRVSATKCGIPWYRDMRYIFPKHDEQLGREIVNLETVCWLHLSYKFEQVHPGRYTAVLRMDIKNGRWPSYGDGTTVQFDWTDDDGPHGKSTKLSGLEWKMLKGSLRGRGTKEEEKASVKISDGWEACNYDSVGGWFDFCLIDLSINSCCDVTMNFKDCTGSWKSGMRWDYIELRPVLGD